MSWFLSFLSFLTFRDKNNCVRVRYSASYFGFSSYYCSRSVGRRCFLQLGFHDPFMIYITSRRVVFVPCTSSCYRCFAHSVVAPSSPPGSPLYMSIYPTSGECLALAAWQHSPKTRWLIYSALLNPWGKKKTKQQSFSP